MTTRLDKASVVHRCFLHSAVRLLRYTVRFWPLMTTLLQQVSEE